MTDEPAASVPFPAATAVEVVHAPVRTGFFPGIATGIALAAITVQLCLAYELAAFREMYREMGSGRLPAGTRMVLTSAWRWGVPAAGLAMVAGLIVVRPRRAWPYVAIALVMVVTAIATWYLARSPVYELAGNIEAG
jgi:hypothetical protein